MLDQNTDRMWYVIGAIVIGAAIIAMGLNIFDETFDSVEDSYASVIGIAGDYVDYIGVDTTIIADGLYKYQGVPDGYQIVGFNEEYIIDDLNGEQPKHLSFPEEFNGQKVTHIGRNAFRKKGIESVDLEGNIEHIGQYAFGQNSIKDLVISDNVISTSNYSFYGNSMERVTFGKGLKRIGSTTFESNRLQRVVIPDNVEEIGGGAFYSNQISDLKLSSNLKEISPWAFSNNQLPDDQAFIYARNQDGSADISRLVSYGGAKRTDIVVPNHVVVIERNAFMNNFIHSITIPDSVTYIGERAFRNSYLTVIDLPDSVRFIGEDAFIRHGLDGNIVGKPYGGRWVIENGRWVRG